MPLYRTSLRLMLRMLARDWRAGEMTVLGIALVLAVAALTSVGFLSDRVERALKLEAHQLLGADLLLTADKPWPDDMREAIRGRGLRLAETAAFPSMVFTPSGAQLATVKAVSASYPLRGRLRTAPALNTPDAPVGTGPATGVVWADERLASLLALTPGMHVGLGRAQPRLGAILTAEPERGMNVTMLAPRLMMNLDDLPSTDLVQPGSRITYRLLVAGESEAVGEFAAWVKPRLGRGESIEDLENARPEVRNVIERAQRFLRLAALLAVVLAAVAVALAAERYMRRHLDSCAVMRCLGASELQLLMVHGGEFLVFGVIATVMGCVLGYGMQLWLLQMLAGLVFQELPAPSVLPWLHGLSIGLVLLSGFALPPLLRLKQVPTVRVLRRELGTVAADGGLVRYLFGVFALGALMLWIAGDVKLGLIVLGGFLSALALYGAVGWALVKVLARWRPAGAGYGWRHGIANLVRYRRATLVQSVALGLGLTAILLLTLARGDMLDTWRRKAPPDAPNRFLINVQPDQRAAISTFFTAAGLAPPLMEPMVRARLMRINDAPVSATAYEDDRAKRLVDREFNLSWTAHLPAGNEVVAGAWHGAGGGMAEFSVEQGLAETLRLKLGDRLEYQIGGQPVTGVVSSLRKLDWDSMRVNFFVLAPPGVLDRYSASYISSFHVPAGKDDVMVRLVQQFPNLTTIDVGGFVKQLQETLDQVATAIQWVFAFAVAAGLAVLLAALQSSGDERRHEVAVLRALGARRPQLQRAMAAEFLVLGGLAGVLGGAGAAVIGWTLAKFVFKLDYWPALGMLGQGVLIGWVLVGLAGAWAAVPILRQPPLRTLREAL